MARAGHVGPRVSPMIARRPVPKRHWRSCGHAPLPSGAEALNEPFSAFLGQWVHRLAWQAGAHAMEVVAI
jgi:hypothetical protein